MRAAEALMLGSTMLRPVAVVRDDGEGGGCALGMIHAGRGEMAHFMDSGWMHIPDGEPLPCDCKGDYLMGSCCMLEHRIFFDDPVSRIVHLFNYHVCEKKDWTLERLADYIDEMEPRYDDEETAQVLDQSAVEKQ